MSEFNKIAECPEEVDGLVDILSHTYRRQIVRYLDENATPVALADLARDIEPEASPDGSRPSAEDVYLELYHWHAPKLAEADAIAFDSDRKMVDTGTDFSVVVTFLTAL